MIKRMKLNIQLFSISGTPYVPFEDLPSTNTPIDSTNLNTMQTDIQTDIQTKVESKKVTINLLNVVATAPTTCATGDIYFNTTDNLLYTATATNTWSTTGTSPVTNVVYIDTTNNKTYYYNGTTLISVGGGSGTESYDSLPVGSEIYYSGTTAPTGYTEVTDPYTPITLYEATTGTTGTVTLSDSSANYSSIEITFTKAGAYATQKVFNPNGKDVTLILPNWYASRSLQILYKKVNINGISITFLYGGYILTVNGATTQSDENNLAIVKVVGYK